jgi:hypothetical protein
MPRKVSEASREGIPETAHTSQTQEDKHDRTAHHGAQCRKAWGLDREGSDPSMRAGTEEAHEWYPGVVVDLKVSIDGKYLYSILYDCSRH